MFFSCVDVNGAFASHKLEKNPARAEKLTNRVNIYTVCFINVIKYKQYSGLLIAEKGIIFP